MIHLTERQIISLRQFRFSTPIRVQAASPVEGGTPGTVMVTDATGRVFFLLDDGSMT